MFYFYDIFSWKWVQTEGLDRFGKPAQINYNMDIVVTNMNKIYLLGGSFDENQRYLSPRTVELDLVTMIATVKPNMCLYCV